MSIIDRRRGGRYAGVISLKKSAKLKEDWCERYIGIDKQEPVPIGVFPKINHFELYTLWDSNLPSTDSIYCSHFGCGRTLSLTESMCGDKCIKHSEPGKTIF